MWASFNGNPSTKIIYLTDSSGETDIITFYSGQFSLVRYIPKHNVLIIGGDIDSQENKDGNKFCQHNSPNRNEEYLADFSPENRQARLNTKFQNQMEICTSRPTQINLKLV